MSIRKIIELIEEEIRNEERILAHMERRLREMPPGSLCVNRINNREYTYQKAYSGGKQMSFRLDPLLNLHREAIGDLMEKKTIVHSKSIIRKNISFMKKCADGLTEYHPANYKYGDLLGKEYYLEDDVCIRDWRKKGDSQNDAFRENLIHTTNSGVKVRSKSEVLIADTLYNLGIEFKYEAELKLGEKTVYPDFEILHPRTYKLIWWEHFGMADDSDYANNMFEKLTEYGAEDIVMGRNLIVTFESKDLPLTHEQINGKLRKYGLI